MQFTFGVVIPTIGTPSVLLPTLRRLIDRLPAEGTLISVCLNPIPATSAFMAQVERELIAMSDELEGTPHDLIWSNEGRGIGFAGACNRGLENMVARLEGGALPFLTVFFNDDLRVTPGWLEGLKAAATTSTIRLASEPPSVMPTDGREVPMINGRPMGVRPSHAVELFGRIGMVGPCSVNVAGMQNIKQDPAHPITEKNADSYARLFRRDNGGDFLSASFLSGFCMGVVDRCLDDLATRKDGRIVGLFSDLYNKNIAGYEDNELCVRATEAGWRLVVDAQTFIYHLGHQSFDAHFPDMQRGMKNRLVYYAHHREKTQKPDQRVIGIYRCRIETGNDIGLWRASLVGMSRLCDGFAVVLTDNPLECTKSQDFGDVVLVLSQIDRAWLGACRNQDGSSASPLEIAEATRAWIRRTLQACEKSHGARQVPVEVRCWTGTFNERDERNRAIEVGEFMGADWLWSIDHDEIPEERITRRHVNRWLSHPDPMVTHWDFSWLNHWDSERQIRVDSPWGDAVNGRPTYQGGMHGYRLWRVMGRRDAPVGDRILAGTANGLHCGNCPEAGAQAKRVAGFRFRHLGYLRHFDRVRKLRRYSEQDPNPDPWLVGADGYGHLVQEEGAVFYPYVQINGVGLHMLVYEKEDPNDVGRILDSLYGVVDRVVLVWTGAQPSGAMPDPWDLDVKWPTEGPSRELAQYADLFKAEIVYKPLNNNIAEARNHGLAALREYAAEGLGWGLFLDPDEHLPDGLGEAVAIRRMAEVSNGWGWLFRFHNLQPDGGQPTASESMRMCRLDPEGIMRMNGRVHEGFDEAVQTLVERGEHPQLRYSPFVLLNLGQKIDDASMQGKLDKYVDLLRLELVDNPMSTKGWVSLGLHAENEGDQDTAMECYRRAMLCPGNSYLPFKEAALYHLRMARVLTGEVVERTAGAHAYHRIAKDQLEWLRENAPPRPLLGAARTNPDGRTGLGFELPPFPGPVASTGGPENEPAEPGATQDTDTDIDPATAPPEG